MSTFGAPEVDRRSLPLYEAGSIDVPYVIDGMNEAIERNTFWEEHSHPTHELIWNTRGASSLTVGPRTWTITPAVGLWIPAGVRHTAWTPAGTWYRTAMFSVQTTAPIADEPVAVDVTDLLRLLLDRLAEPGLEDASRATTEAMVLDVLAPSPHELLLRIPDSPLLAPIVDAARADVRDAGTLEEWSVELGVSARTITRQFQSETGLGFSRWVATARIQRAIVLLTDGESIDDVAVATGFRSASAFGTAFRRVTGMSPGRFRAQ
ncbi:AraC family transcriptional regulator [Pseudoclavibacter sp. AY1H1]|uniref:helix-turn-helix domain-containing protein n=1 Tax=Pseudoclavibacter sp. AY1H1 TaxID=2080584 RepID=UPI000CE7BB4B|nr:AraC family transcriptional regulator [Pseudoclavibacter sp. AY1H1]PPF40399.1 AraC family transcriptional regulator [Pseudoclavibacter sp. AY1H1]